MQFDEDLRVQAYNTATKHNITTAMYIRVCANYVSQVALGRMLIS